MYLLIVLFPLIEFLFGILTGCWLSLGVGFVTTFCTFLFFLFSVIVCYINLCSAQIAKVHLTPWLLSDSLFLNYFVNYLKNGSHKTQFMSYLFLFTLFMLILITGNNFIHMFVGWGGIGLSSYLLINFWFTRIQVNKSAVKAILINRVGDFFLLLAIFSLFFIFKTLSYDIVFSLSPLLVGFELQLVGIKLPIIDLICFLSSGAILFGATVALLKILNKNQLFKLASLPVTFFDEFTLLLKSLSDQEQLCLIIIGTFFIFVSFLIWLKDTYKEESTVICKKLQDYCSQNQTLVFSGAIGGIFAVSLVEMPLCDSLIGLAFLFNALRLLYFLHRENLPYVETFIFVIICYRYITNPNTPNQLGCLILLYYVYSTAGSMVFNLPTVEKLVERVQEMQRPTAEHMRSELLYFLILERAVFFYLSVRFTLGGDVLCSVLGSELNIILSFYFNACWVVCSLARLLATVAFNPLSERFMLGLGLCASCGSFFLGTQQYLDDSHTKSTSGRGITPKLGFICEYWQMQTWGCTAATSQEVDAANIYVAVYGKTPPKIPQTNRINLWETIETLENDTRPEVQRRYGMLKESIKISHQNITISPEKDEKITSKLSSDMGASKKPSYRDILEGTKSEEVKGSYFVKVMSERNSIAGTGVGKTSSSIEILEGKKAEEVKGSYFVKVMSERNNIAGTGVGKTSSSIETLEGTRTGKKPSFTKTVEESGNTGGNKKKPG
jgi:hypothetical protein